VKNRGPVFAWMVLIFLLSAQSQLPTPEQRWLDFVLEKSAHFVEYAVLGALLFRALIRAQLGRWRAFALAVLLAWFYALSDEFHQMYVPGRQADWLDIVFDWVGALVGTSAAAYWWAVRQNGVFSDGLEHPPSAKAPR
jgi:VanZ family protein